MRVIPKRSVVVLVAVAALVACAGLALAGGQAAKPAHLGGCQVFPAFNGPADAPSAANQSMWNQDVSHSPVDAHSKRYIKTITDLGGNQAIHPDMGGNGTYGIPYTTVGPNQPKVKVKAVWYPDQSDFGHAPIPPNAPVEGGSDAHVLVMQKGTCKLYEMYASKYLGGASHRWRAGSTAEFNLGSNKLRHAGWTSADAAGLSIFAGLIKYPEVKRGHIDHAIRATFGTTRRSYIKPATHLASDECDPGLPPMGLRFRLGSKYFHQNLHRFPKGSQSRVIFTALYHYGIVNADNGSAPANWYVGGARSKQWKDGDLNRLKSVPGTAFVVVKSAAKQTTPC